MLLQWHITEMCNLRCRHCYQENIPLAELGWLEKRNIYQQFLAFLKKHPRFHKRGHITITGGEPFLSPDFWSLAEMIFRDHKVSWGILTNGTLIDDSIAHHLAELKPSFIQVSIEGSSITHDSIRGYGSFDKTVLALETLHRYHLHTMISFTAHKKNYQEFPEVAKLGQKLGVTRVWADRLIPYGSASSLKSLLLTPEETCHFFHIMRSSKKSLYIHETWARLCKIFFRYKPNTEIAMNRALQFLAGGYPYHCHAGDDLITIMPDGTLYPCRRMPVAMGNVMINSIATIYETSDFLLQLRKKKIGHTCQKCMYAGICQGGLKCLAYCLTNDPWSGDPGCWKLQELS